jgi:hypothetical protein
MYQQAKPSPIEVLDYLRDVHFPTEKAALVRAAQQKEAPSEVIKTIANLPKQYFHWAGEVTIAMNQTS